MKVIVHLTLTDDERGIFNAALCKKGMASRKDVHKWVTEAVGHLLETQEINNEQWDETDSLADGTVQVPVPVEPETSRSRSIPGFVPSRGDEPYLYKAQDGGLAKACSQVLDGLEYIKAFTWETLERNRK